VRDVVRFQSTFKCCNKLVQSLATSLLILLACGSPAVAQDDSSKGVAETNTVHTDFRTPGPWFLIPYHSPAVKAARTTDSDRLAELIRGDTLYLTLEDAIDLAIENNFDVEIQRFDHEFALTDIMRSKGGGLLRGITTTITEMPSGEGGPGEPLLTTVGGYSPVIQLPSSAANLATITSTTTDLSVTGSTAPASSTTGPITSTLGLSNGPAVPQFDPEIVGQVSISQQIMPQPSSFGTGSNVEESHGLLVNVGYQQSFSPGTQLMVTTNSNSINSSSMSNNLNPSTSGYFDVSIVQPLLQGFGIRMNRRFIRVAKNEDKIADYVFRQQLISTVSDITRLYWDFVSLTADLKVKRESLAEARRLYEDTRNRVEQGTQAPVQLTSAQAQVATSLQDFINSEGLVLQQELLLKELLTRRGISEPRIAKAKIEALTAIQTPDRDTIDPLGTLLQQAIENRPDLRLAQVQLENTNISLEGSRNDVLPQLDVVASMQNNGLAGSANPNASSSTMPASSGLMGGYGTVEQQIFSRDYPSYSVGVQLNIPLRNRVARSDLTRDELQKHQTEVRINQLHSQVRLQVGNAEIAVRQARNSYEAAVEARILQQQALDVEQARYDEGVDTAFDLIQYERNLAQAESAEVSALGVYAKSKSALERAVGLTLKNNNVSVEEAYDGKVSRPPSTLPAVEPAR
jgi:outer membrane protein